MTPASYLTDSMGAGVMLAVAGTVPGVDWSRWGLAAAVIGVVLWQSWQREARLGARIDLLEDRQTELLERAVRAEECMATAVTTLSQTPCPRETASRD